MKKISILNSLTFVNNISADDIINVQSDLRKRDGHSFKYSKKIIDNLPDAFQMLRPLTFKLCNRYLFLMGKNGSLAVYSNFVFGGAADITACSAWRFNADEFFASWDNYERAHLLDSINIPSNPRVHFTLNAWLRRNGERRRTIGCTINSNGDIYTCNSGDYFPFEIVREYTHLDDGVIPDIRILEGFSGLFGWPPPYSSDFPKYVETCILYEFESTRDFPEIPVNEALQEEALKWPWD